MHRRDVPEASADPHRPTRVLGSALSLVVLLATLVLSGPAVAAGPDQASLEAQALASLRDGYRRMTDPTAVAGRALVGTTKQGNIAISGAERLAFSDGLRALRPFAAWGTFNKAAAASYARSWWNGWNMYYPHYGLNDCANFMSQTKAAGGWTAKSGPGWWPDAWWYNGSDRTHSTSWSAADWLLGFTTNSGRGYFLGAFADLDVGDYLYADWGYNGVGNQPEHSMIVTTRLSGSYWDIKLTYHSEDRLDKPLQQIMNERPGSVYWGTRVPYTSN